MKVFKHFVPFFLFATLALKISLTKAQQNVVKDINSLNPAPIALAPLRFLASDELMGRSVSRPEIHVASRYISEEFWSMGLQSFPGAQDYFQSFQIRMVSPAKTGSVKLGSTTFSLPDNILQWTGNDVQIEAPVVYAGFGTAEEFDKLNVQGKIVITEFGGENNVTAREGFAALKKKEQLAKEKGALVLIEHMAKPPMPWSTLQHYTLRERPETDTSKTFPVLLMNDSSEVRAMLEDQTINATISIVGSHAQVLKAENVVGYVEGTDPALKKQYVLLSAHYDHIGVSNEPKMEEGKMDSIYNGARDNAIGVTAVMDAARYFAAHPAKRSVMFVAYTGEEIGIVGSKYFAEHPVIPLNQIVYNLNIDNANYNDTTIVSVVGLGRTSADDDIIKASAAFGLKAVSDPVPEQNLFDRSDNVSLAVKGIPAPSYSLGFTSFDSTITKRYHQLSDEVGDLDTNYVMKYIKGYILSAKYIADNVRQPTWKKDDKYEAAWKELYKK